MNKPNLFIRFLARLRRKKPQLDELIFEDNLYTKANQIQVGFMGTIFLQIPPMVSAVIIQPDGSMKLVESSGYVVLPLGMYLIHYVDMRVRFTSLPDIVAISSDGLKIKVNAAISYEVKDPILVLEMADAVPNLISTCISVVKNVFQIHKYNELIVQQEINTKVILADEIVRQIRRSLTARPFTLHDITFREVQEYLENELEDETRQILAGDSTTDAPLPDVRKKKRK